MREDAGPRHNGVQKTWQMVKDRRSPTAQRNIPHRVCSLGSQPSFFTVSSDGLRHDGPKVLVFLLIIASDLVFSVSVRGGRPV